MEWFAARSPGNPRKRGFLFLVGCVCREGPSVCPEDLQNGCTVVLAHSFWQTELGAPGIVGAALALNGNRAQSLE